MGLDFADLTFADLDRECLDGNGFPTITFGKRSYFDQSCHFRTNTDIPGNLLVGHYSALASNCTFIIASDHNKRSASTYPFKEVYQLLDENYPLLDKLSKNTPLFKSTRQCIVGSDCWLGNGAKVVGNVRIGNGAIVGSGAVVTKDVPPYAVVAGNPAKIVKYRFSPEIIQKLQCLRWWHWDTAKVEAAMVDLVGDIEQFLAKHQPPPVLPPTEEYQKLFELKSRGYRLMAVHLNSKAHIGLIYLNLLKQYLEHF